MRWSIDEVILSIIDLNDIRGWRKKFRIVQISVMGGRVCEIKPVLFIWLVKRRLFTRDRNVSAGRLGYTAIGVGSSVEGRGSLSGQAKGVLVRSAKTSVEETPELSARALTRWITESGVGSSTKRRRLMTRPEDRLRKL
jgi:hypothetical protein